MLEHEEVLRIDDQASTPTLPQVETVVILGQSGGAGFFSEMSPLVRGVGLPLFVLSMMGVGIVGAIRRRRQTNEAVAAARGRGLNVDSSSKSPPDLAFDLFGVGSSRTVQNQMWRSDSPNSVFSYRYTTSSGEHRRTHHFTCAMVSLSFWAPHTTIGPESFFSKIGSAIGFTDIEIESELFNRMYRVTSKDERFAVTLLDAPLISWFIERNPFDPTRLRVELAGPWMLLIRGDVPTDEHEGFLDWAATVPEHFPDVLLSLWPPRPGPAT